METQAGIQENEDEKTSSSEQTMKQSQGVVTTRSGRQIVRLSTYAALTKVARSEWEQEAEKGVIKSELQQLFQELVA